MSDIETFRSVGGVGQGMVNSLESLALGTRDASASTRVSGLPLGLDLGAYAESNVTLDPETAAFWFEFRQAGVPRFTLALLSDLAIAHKTIHRLVNEAPVGSAPPVKFFVCCSATPNVFSYGGDLALFQKCVRERNRQGLLAYAYACVEAIYNNAFGYEVPVVSVGVLQGDALGGGFEGAISFNILIAERGIKMGMPEVLFNAFPGMGAHSLLSRKLGAARAEKLIFGGKLHSAEEMHELGLVHILADPGKGREAARKFLVENARRYKLLHSYIGVRQKADPVTLRELREITEIWVDTVLQLEEADLRKMEILHSAQLRRAKRPAP